LFDQTKKLKNLFHLKGIQGDKTVFEYYHTASG